MNEKNAYGYNVGWNVENEYVESLNSIMIDYNAQAERIQDIITSMKLVDSDIIRINQISEEQIRNWYNEDYVLNNRLVPFEKYKEDILNSIKEKNRTLNIDVERNRDRYFANLKILIDTKEDARKVIHKKRSELELLLSEKNIELSSILMQQGKIRPEYDPNRNIINADKLAELRQKYDACWLEIRKIEHALNSLNDIVQLMEFTQEEKDLMMRGLNPQQRKIYDDIKKPTQILETTSESISEQISETISDPILEPMPGLVKETTQELEEEPHGITLDGIINKVCGDEKFNDSQSNRYAASKIKVFSKPQKSDFGLANKVVSIPKVIIGVIPKTVMKAYGLFIPEKTKQAFKEMEERANNLTDQEVELLLKEYKGATAQSKRLPKGFNNAIRPRVDKYISAQVAKINERINENLLKINHCSSVVNSLKSKLSEEQSQEMVERMNEVLATSYKEGASCVKELIVLQIEVNNLQNSNELHSFGDELKALDTKLNYVGGRFSKGREYDPQLWSKISGYSHKIEYSLDSKDVFESYIKREEIYKENAKEIDSIRYVTTNLDDSIELTDLQSSDMIGTSLTSAQLVPDILTLGAVTDKVEQEQNDPKKEVKQDSKRASEIRSMIDDLKSMKAELTSEEIKELEDLLRR